MSVVVSVNVQMGLKDQTINVVNDTTIKPVAQVPIKDLVSTLITVAEKNQTKKISLTGPKRFIAPFKEILENKGYVLLGRNKK